MKIVSMKNVFLGLASMCFALSASAAVTNIQAVDRQDGDSGYIKPHAPVDVRHKVLGDAIPGQPVDVEIILLPGRMAEAVSAEFRTNTGMRESRRGNVERVAIKGAPMATRQVVTFVPSVEGLHYVTVFAKVQVQGREQGRVMAFAVQVGNSTVPVRKAEPAMGELKETADGSMVRSLPARQTIKEPEQDK